MYVRYILMSEMEKRYSFFIENDMTGKTFSIVCPYTPHLTKL